MQRELQVFKTYNLCCHNIVMSGVQKNKRITFKHTRPNPIFQSWLQELYDEAKEKNSKLESMLKISLDSLSKYPLPLNSGADCAILQGFGKKLCQFLDQRLQVYNSLTREEKEAITASQSFSGQSNNSNEIDNNLSSESNTDESQVNPHTNNISIPKSSKILKPYKPTYKSGGYAILLALLNESKEFPNTALKKEELIEKAQPFSEESFTRPKPESFYTAWSNMPRLIRKGLVSKTGTKKAMFSLTNEGIKLAEELLRDSQNIPTVNDIIFNYAPVEIRVDLKVDITKLEPLQSSQKSQHSSNEEQSVEMIAGSFDVILLIDKMETSGLAKKNDPTVAQFKKFPDLKHEYRHLKVGDFTWIARSKVNTSKELVLPFIVERKRMDDLGSSIKDGRFHEQKFRLRKCGLKNVIYLVEHYGSNKFVGLPYQSLMQALANTRVHDEFKIHITSSLTNSARFLAMMTKRLTIEYQDKNLKGAVGKAKKDELMSFPYFNKTSSKNKALTVTETFIKILLQLKGMSVEKALAITNKYRTPKDLIEKYKRCSEREGELLLTNLKYGDLGVKNVGPAVSKVVYQLFTLKDFQ